MIERMMQQDKNGDGKLSRDELPEERADRMIGNFDKNGDGAIDREEAEQMAQSVQRLRGERE